MSRIVIVLPHLRYGGAQRVASLLADGWLGQGHDVAVIALTTGGQEIRFPKEVRQINLFDRPPRWTVFHLAGAFRTLRLIVRLRSCLKRSRATHVVSFLRATNVKIIPACLGLGVRLVISERNDPSKQHVSKLWDILAALFYKYPDAVTANSHRVIAMLGATVPHAKLAYLPNPLGTPPQCKVKLLRPTILAVGRIVPQKGYDVLLRAFAAAGLDTWQLVVLGNGSIQSQMKALSETLGIEKQILWLGYSGNPFPYYRSADIFVSSSHFEGTSNSLLEAMQCGLPPVVTSASDEIVSHERNGLVVPTGDCVSLGRALSRLASDAELRARLARGAEARAADFHISRTLPVWNHVAGI